MASRYAPAPFATLTAEQWHAGRAVDLDAAFYCARAAAPEMREGGRIINIADWLPASGRTRYTDFLPYYVAKGGVIALTEALALELAPQRVLVNAIAPGPILPPEGATADGDRGRRGGDAARPLGRRRGNREGRALPHRQRLRHGRSRPGGWGTASQIEDRSQNSEVRMNALHAVFCLLTTDSDF